MGFFELEELIAGTTKPLGPKLALDSELEVGFLQLRGVGLSPHAAGSGSSG